MTIIKKGTKVRCINAGGNRLTNGKVYELSKDFDQGNEAEMRVTNDDGLVNASYYANRFAIIEEIEVGSANYMVERYDGMTKIIVNGKLTNQQVAQILAVVQ